MGGKWNRWKNPIKDERGLLRVYTVWCNMIHRVGKAKTYVDITVSEDFKDYDYFHDWFYEQKGCMSKDDDGRWFELDNDLVGRNTYSQDTCLFIPKEVNSLFKRYRKSNTTLPLGVSKENSKNVYKASMSLNNKHQHIGYFKTPEEASVAYQSVRNARLLEVLEEYEDDLDARVCDIIMNHIKTSAG